MAGVELAIGAVALLCGFLIGAVAIGGVLMAPALILLLEIAPHQAVAISLTGFLATGILGAAAYLRTPDASRSGGVTISIAALAGAAIGAIALRETPATVVAWIIGSIVIASAIDRLWRKQSQGQAEFSRGTAGAMGLVTGLISAMSGTGGPLVLLPLLSWRGIPARAAIRLAQAVQLPVAAAATMVNWQVGLLAPAVLPVVTGAMAIGMLAGLWVSARLRNTFIENTLTLALIAAGILVIARNL